MGSCLGPVLFGQSLRPGTSSTFSKSTKLALMWWETTGRQTSVWAAWVSQHMCTWFCCYWLS